MLGTMPLYEWSIKVSNDNNNANNSNGGSDPAQNTGQPSQDAKRHQQDSKHHKYHKGPQQDGADRSPQSLRRSQSDNDEMNQSGAKQQPEIPKVGSRDAPGG
jgi:hypothetical protein